MAAETEEKKPEQVEEKQAEGKTAEPEQTPKKPSKPPEKRELLLPILMVLFILVGVGDLILWSLTGFGVFRGTQARRAYEAQQASLESGAERPLGASYSGPGLTIENGEVVWRRTNDLTQNNGSSGVGSSVGMNTQPEIESGLWIPYPPPPWGRETTSDRAGQSETEPANQTPVQT